MNNILAGYVDGPSTSKSDEPTLKRPICTDDLSSDDEPPEKKVVGLPPKEKVPEIMVTGMPSEKKVVGLKGKLVSIFQTFVLRRAIALQRHLSCNFPI